MTRFWSWYQNIGVTEGVQQREIRYVRASNGLVFGLIALLLLQIPEAVELLPESRLLLASLVLAPLLLQLVPILNRRGNHTLARVWFSVASIALVVIDSIRVGAEGNNDLLMIAVVLGAFCIYPPRQARYIAAVCIASAAIMLWLEFRFAERQAVLAQQPASFWSARFESIAALFLIVLVMAVYTYVVAERAEDRVETEHQHSERILLNVLPAPIAARVKTETVIAERAPSATVMFARLLGLNGLASTMPAAELVQLLNRIFSEFDRISTNFKLEKIRTIGGVYMLAGGIPTARPDHAEAVAACALEMLSFMDSIADEARGLQLRIGIHTGPVVAGVIGGTRFAYDLWGDTVDIASRMESQGVPDRIQVSQDVFDRLDYHYVFEPRGIVDLNGRGDMELYLLCKPRRDFASMARAKRRYSPMRAMMSIVK